MADELIRFLGTTLGLGQTQGGGTHENMLAMGDAVTDSFATPQPVGLTNVQCKLVGSLFTETPTHHHPGETVATLLALSQGCGNRPLVSASTAAANSLTVFPLTLSPQLLSSEDIDHSEDNVGLCEAQLMSVESPEEADAVQAVLDGLDTATLAERSRRRDAYLPLLRDVDLKRALFVVTGGVIGSLVRAPYFGYGLERAVSIALIGSDCHWNVLNSEIVAVLCSAPSKNSPPAATPPPEPTAASIARQEIFQLVRGKFGFKEEDVRAFAEYVAAGLRVPPEMEQVKLYVLAQVIGRNIVVLAPATATSRAQATGFLASRTTGSAADRKSLPALVLVVDASCTFADAYDTVLLHGAGARLAGSVVLTRAAFPQVVIVGGSAGTNLGTTDPDDERDDHPIHEMNDVLMMTAAHLAEVPVPAAGADPAFPTTCQKYIDSDGRLTFSWFPGCGFALVDDPALGRAMRAAPGYGADADAEGYLQASLRTMRNVVALRSDADGHCLLHSVSRCLVGKEYLWHALRHALHRYMVQHGDDLVTWFKRCSMLVSLEEEYPSLVSRVAIGLDISVQPFTPKPAPATANAPQPPTTATTPPPTSTRGETTAKGSSEDNTNEASVPTPAAAATATSQSPAPASPPASGRTVGSPLLPPTTLMRGLGIEHVFALANMLRRPILLLDAPVAHHQCFVVLPLLINPAECSTRSLLVIGWSNEQHGHYVPIVPLDSTKPAWVDLNSLPYSEGETADLREILVYGCPDGESGTALFYRYVDIATSAPAATTGSPAPRVVLISGGANLQTSSSSSSNPAAAAAFEVRPWAAGIAQRFEAKHQTTLWKLHEAMRCALQGNQLTSQQLEVINDLSAFSASLVSFAKRAQFDLCTVCTRTFTRGTRCVTCPTAALRPFDDFTNSFAHHHRDRVPIASKLGFGCCVFKHWILPSDAATLKPGTAATARDLAAAYQPAIIRSFRASTKTYDVVFPGCGRRLNIRFGVPISDVKAGFAIDAVTPTRSLAFGGISANAEIVYDSNPLLCTDPKTFAIKFVEAHISKLPVERRSEALQAEYRRRVEEDATQLVNQLRHDVEKRSLQRGGQFRRPKSTKDALDDVGDDDDDDDFGSDSLVPQKSGMPARPPKFTDETGRAVLWQSEDPRSFEWIDYERDAAGALEAALQDGELSWPVMIPGYGKFTIHFSSWLQENPSGFGVRRVRRLALKPWTCPNCTLENEAASQWCAACASERGQGTYEVLSKRKVVSLFSDFAAQSIARMIEMTERDPRLREGGDLYVSAMKNKLEHQVVIFYNAYGRSTYFIFFEDEKRFVYIPHRIPKTHPAHERLLRLGLLDEGSATLQFGGKVFYIDAEDGSLETD